MGKPFKQELSRLIETIRFAQSVDVAEFRDYINKLLAQPLFIIGSGGSFSACHFTEILHQAKGSIGKAITPLESFYSQRCYKDSNVLMITASGKNKDILFAFDQAIKNEPDLLLSICTTVGSPLSLRASKYSTTKNFEFPLPTGKDGFLASNSLVAFFILLARSYDYDLSREIFTIEAGKKERSHIDTFLSKIDLSNVTFKILYGGWSKPVAVDFESKLTEAALANSLIADFRNFGHGRHHWLDKRKDKTAIIAFITPDEESLANKTLSVLPKDIPVLILKTNKIGAASTIDLLLQSFQLIDKIGDLQGIDPGRPGVPEFGSKLYNLSYSSIYNKKYPRSNSETLYIQRKIKPTRIGDISASEHKKWEKYLSDFQKKIKGGRFGSVVLDYDRTICSDQERLNGPSVEMINQLTRILDSGFIIGIVTGRGRSIRTDLQKAFEKKYWDNIIIGYYNGAQIGKLSNNHLPDISETKEKVFDEIKKLLNIATIKETVDVTIRPQQLTIEGKAGSQWESIKPMLYQKIMLVRDHNFMILESSRSMDIIKRPDVSKLNIISYLKSVLIDNGVSEECLCIGDKGRWPGNDFELLNTSYSLSVNEVSIDPYTCWNMAPLATNNTDASLWYLKKISLHKKYFKIEL